MFVSKRKPRNQSLRGWLVIGMLGLNARAGSGFILPASIDAWEQIIIFFGFERSLGFSVD